MNGKVLITGGLGYLGGRLSKHLSDRGKWATRLTSRRTGNALPSWADAMEVVTADFGDDGDMASLCQGMDAVVHLAAMNADQCANDPEKANRVNVAGTQSLWDAAIKTGVKRFIYVSTVHVYGAPPIGVITENTAPCPAHPYSETHHRAEEIVLSGEGPLGVVLRLSNAIGVPTDEKADCWMLAANDLCRQAVTEKGLHLRGSGLDVRDFVAIADVCRVVEHFLVLKNTALVDRIFNVGGGAITMLGLAECISNRAEVLFGNRPEISRKEPSPGEKAPRLDYRIDRLLGTGFAPTGNIEDEIDATLKFCHQAFG
jgi:UDP-glucose 4-epimerase